MNITYMSISQITKSICQYNNFNIHIYTYTHSQIHSYTYTHTQIHII